MLWEGIRGQTHWNHSHRKLANLITQTTALSNSMKWSRATQDRQVMVERSDKTWSTGEGNDKSLQYSCLENPMNSMKRQKDKTLKDELPRSDGAQYFTEEWRNNSKKNEEMDPKEKHAQIWMWLVMEREAWSAAVHGVAKSWTWLSDWTELIWPGLLWNRLMFAL